MAFRSVGINLPRLYLEGVSGLADDLEALKIAGPDFVEVWPHHLGVILGGSLDAERLRPVRELLLEHVEATSRGRQGGGTGHR
jgi:hypothetical protein